MELSKEQIRETIARRVAQELEDGDVVTLGIGLPTEVANYVPEDVQVMFHSENGLIGVGKKPAPGQANPHITNAGGIPVDIVEGASAFDSVMSFTMIRGGHIDATVLGALQVDQEGILSTGWCRAYLCREWAVLWIWWSARKKLLSRWNTCLKIRLKLLKNALCR